MSTLLRFALVALVLVNTLRADVGAYVQLVNSSAVDQTITVYVDGTQVNSFTVYAGTTNAVSFSHPEGFMLTMKRQTIGAQPQGPSWIYDPGFGTYEQTVFEVPLSANGGGTPPGPLVEVGGPTSILQDYKKPLWVSSDSTLTGDLFREGVDIIASAAASGGGGGGGGTSTFPEPPAGTGSTEAAGVTSLAATATPNAAALKAHFDQGATNTGVLTGFTSNATLTFGNFEILGTTFALEPYTYFPWLEDVGTYFHDLMLISSVLVWFMFARRRLEEYVISTFHTPQLTTKGGPGQMYIPGVGLAKQVAIVSLWITALLAAVAAVLVLVNANLGGLFTGLNITGVTAKSATVLNAISADTRFAPVVQFMSAFFPFSGLFQLLVIHVVYCWTLPGLFAVGLMLSRVVHA